MTQFFKNVLLENVFILLYQNKHRIIIFQKEEDQLENLSSTEGRDIATDDSDYEDAEEDTKVLGTFEVSTQVKVVLILK